MAYEEKRLGRQKVRYNSDNDDIALVYQLLVDGEKVTPTSATIEIFRPGNATAVLAATAMTQAGTLLTYNVTTTTVADFPVGNGYRAEIVVTYDSKTYSARIIFDVVKYILRLTVAFDQLVALDPSVRGYQHDGDEDLSPLINAARDDMQTDIEARVLADDKLIENMILDSSSVSVVARWYILWLIAMNMGKPGDIIDTRKETYDERWRAVLATIRYDGDQDGEEDGEIGGLQAVRLEL